MKSTQYISLAATAAILSGLCAAELSDSHRATDEVGKVTGKIVFEGEKPDKKPVSISDEQSKDCCEPGVKMDTTDRSLLIDDDGGIANVVITVEIKGMKPEVPEKPVVLDQSKCRFSTHVAVVPVGGTISFMNSDKVSHNIHTYATKNDGVNKTVSSGSEMTQKLEKAEAVEVKCDIHPWMNSWVVVTDASLWDVSGEDGSFELEGLPPGKHKLEIWHEKLGKGKAEVTINADGSSEPIEVKMGAKKKSGGRRR